MLFFLFNLTLEENKTMYLLVLGADSSLFKVRKDEG